MNSRIGIIAFILIIYLFSECTKSPKASMELHPILSFVDYLSLIGRVETTSGLQPALKLWGSTSSTHIPTHHSLSSSRRQLQIAYTSSCIMPMFHHYSSFSYPNQQSPDDPYWIAGQAAIKLVMIATYSNKWRGCIIQGVRLKPPPGATGLRFK